MGEDTLETNVRAVRPQIIEQLPEVFFLHHAGAVFPDFDLHQHLGLQAAAGKDILDHFRAFNTVHAEGHVDSLFHQRSDPLQLDSADNFVGNKDILQTVGGHHFRFPDLGHRNSPGAAFFLQFRDLRDLVGLGMRPQTDMIAVGVCLHEADIIHHDVLVNDQSRGVQFMVVHAFSPSSHTARASISIRLP